MPPRSLSDPLDTNAESGHILTWNCALQTHSESQESYYGLLFSEWPFLVATTSVPEYATNRTDRTEEDHQTDRRIVANRRSAARANHEGKSEASCHECDDEEQCEQSSFRPFCACNGPYRDYN